MKWVPAPVVPEQVGQPGEMGKPVQLPAEQESLMREKFRLNQFNLLASDSISLNRSLPDVRLEGYVNNDCFPSNFYLIVLLQVPGQDLFSSFTNNQYRDCVSQ